MEHNILSFCLQNKSTQCPLPFYCSPWQELQTKQLLAQIQGKSGIYVILDNISYVKVSIQVILIVFIFLCISISINLKKGAVTLCHLLWQNFCTSSYSKRTLNSQQKNPAIGMNAIKAYTAILLKIWTFFCAPFLFFRIAHIVQLFRVRSR